MKRKFAVIGFWPALSVALGSVLGSNAVLLVVGY